MDAYSKPYHHILRPDITGESSFMRLESPISLPRSRTSGPSATVERSCSCPQHHILQGRNLVICIDGTSNQFGGKNTNVIEFYHLLVKDETQLTYYNSGIGTYAEPSWKSPSYWVQVVENKVDLAIAWNLEKIINRAYRWLADNYREGDVVYLIGFSRGAYQVRALAAMIQKVGLIHKGNEDQIPFAYELFADPNSANIPHSTSVSFSSADSKSGVSDTDEDDSPRSSAQHFKETFSREVRVHFVGAWDTVSSVGIIRGKTLPLTTDGMCHVCHFRHALALDERRVKFLPEYAYGDATIQHNQSPTSPALDGKKAHMKEVWFAGTHSDIGGGNTPNPRMDRSGPPLLWMLTEAAGCGLWFNSKAQAGKRWSWANKDGIHESLTGVWRLAEYLPLKRLSYTGNGATTRRPHLGKGRKVLPGQLIHGSVVHNKSTTSYTPKASPPRESMEDWIQVDERMDSQQHHDRWHILDEDLGSLRDDDLFGAVQTLTEKRAKRVNVNEIAKEIIRILQSPGGHWTLAAVPDAEQFIVDIIHQLQPGTPIEVQDLMPNQLAKALLRITNGNIKAESTQLLLPITWPIIIRGPAADMAPARNMLKRFIDNQQKPFCLSKLPDVRITDDDIGALCDKGEFALVYTDTPILSIAYSPDGRHILSGSRVSQIQFWDAVSGVSTAAPLVLPDSYTDTSLMMVPTNPEIGRLKKRGTMPEALEQANLALSAVVRPLQLRARKIRKGAPQIRCLTVSPDSKYIASGSSDRTIQLWSAETNQKIGKPLEGHTSDVSAVAFSPDSQYLLSASFDQTIRRWRLSALDLVLYSR